MSADSLKLFVALDALLEHGNVTKAARQLGISQPALSAQLARLRELLGDPLLVPARGGRGMVLTAQASTMKEPLRTALSQLRHVFAPPVPFTPTRSERTFTLILNDNAAAMLAGPLIAAAQQAGGRGIRMAFLHPRSDIGGALESGEADIAIGSPPEAKEGLICRDLLRDGYQVACRPGLLPGPMDLDAYTSLPHVMVSAAGGHFSSAIDLALARLGRERRVAVSVQSYAVVPTVVAQSDCLCTLPRRLLARYRSQLEIHDLPFAMADFSLSAIWHGRVTADPTHIWLREQLFAVAALTPQFN
ncbi:LysR family transcriptional regulator [Telmatospirillum siberiense]|uniref:LysR family transcriptional regulator n=1 Tax=Telmatospirillum siberiense TaxID=382514 RepID=A0A2N3PYZ8_9PROT|nr:LysR family transcriptional regulator [Telmatospirillum siberiense]PKU25644.1 LysR family transcriptional regulator [Telmatospirillum siberiense]